jgi:hypothetical protein
MPKTFDCENEPNKFMDMPCMCDCGNWFDLNDGYNSRHSNKIICRECKERENCKKCGNEGWIYLKNGGLKKCNKCNS